jgi:hypothetical protein
METHKEEVSCRYLGGIISPEGKKEAIDLIFFCKKTGKRIDYYCDGSCKDYVPQPSSQTCKYFGLGSQMYSDIFFCRRNNMVLGGLEATLKRCTNCSDYKPEKT